MGRRNCYLHALKKFFPYTTLTWFFVWVLIVIKQLNFYRDKKNRRQLVEFLISVFFPFHGSPHKPPLPLWRIGKYSRISNSSKGKYYLHPLWLFLLILLPFRFGQSGFQWWMAQLKNVPGITVSNEMLHPGEPPLSLSCSLLAEHVCRHRSIVHATLVVLVVVECRRLCCFLRWQTYPGLCHFRLQAKGWISHIRQRGRSLHSKTSMSGWWQGPTFSIQFSVCKKFCGDVFTMFLCELLSLDVFVHQYKGQGWEDMMLMASEMCTNGSFLGPFPVCECSGTMSLTTPLLPAVYFSPGMVWLFHLLCVCVSET